MNKLLVICGPTATGKTRIALSLASYFHGEIISADSRQIYKGMDIGTGKSDSYFLKKDGKYSLSIPHGKNSYTISSCTINSVQLWMYDVVRPDEEFSVAIYQHLAKSVIASIIRRNHLPIIAGGTGLYIRSIVSGIDTADIPPDNILRRTVEKLPLNVLQNFLIKEDIASWNIMNRSDRSNPRRLIRKIEISRWRKNNKRKKTNESEKKNVLTIGLTAPREQIYKNIDRSVDERIRRGAQREVKALLSKGYSWEMPSFDSMGYREWKPFFEEHASVSSIIPVWKNDEHGYARRQLTWFTKQKDVVWFDITKPGYQKDVEALACSWYTYHAG